jgi:hypothetical protein
MAKQTVWQAKLDGTDHSFALDVSRGPKSVYTLRVDEEIRLSFPAKWSSFFSGGYDVAFTLNGRDVRLVVLMNGKADIVADGRRLSDGKPYVPMPGWSWIFGIQVIILGIMGGALGVLCGLAGFSACVRVARTALHTVLRVLLCVIFSALAWVVYIVIGFIVIGLIYAAG